MSARLPLLVTAVFFSACTAQMVEKRGESATLSGLLGGDKPEKGGVVRYLNTGRESWVKARRSDAEKKIARYCKGPYAITAEGPRSKFGAAMPTKGAALEVDQYTYLAFTCNQ